MLKTYFQQRISPELSQVRQVRTALSNLLKKLQYPQSSSNDLLLGLSELLVNIIQHGTPAAKQVEVHLKQDVIADCWWLEIYDDSGRFDSTAQARVAGDLAGNLSDENGRGLSLLQALFPDSSYQPAAVGCSSMNCFRIYLGGWPLSRPKVMVVDDDSAISRLLSLYLQEHYEVDCCGSAEEAMERLEEHPVDLLISDINMSSTSGLVFRQQLLTE